MQGRGERGTDAPADKGDLEPKRDRFRGRTWESNLIVGSVLCALGLIWEVPLVGTHSALALTAVGAGLLVWGAVGWWLRRTP